jgi:hypothetical protein
MSSSRVGLQPTVGPASSDRSKALPLPSGLPPGKAGRIGDLLEELLDVEPGGSCLGHLENYLAARFDQFSGNVDHLPANPDRCRAEEVLDEEVVSLAGERYSRKEDGNPFRRWRSNSGSIRIDGEKVPIDVPRVRNTDTEEERSLESYQAMKNAEVGPELTKAILLGLSQGDYQQVAGQFIDGFGLSQSSVSRRFQERAQQALEEFENRSLEEENFLALWIDGKRIAGEQGDPLHGSCRVRLQEGARLHAGDD